MFKASLFIGIGGFLGSISRYLLSQYVDKKIITLFPFGTFTVNILGCFLLGLLYALAEKEQVLTNELRLLLTVGFCGSFTTFSTFSY
jgi:CrcB protein